MTYRTNEVGSGTDYRARNRKEGMRDGNIVLATCLRIQRKFHILHTRRDVQVIRAGNVLSCAMWLIENADEPKRSYANCIPDVNNPLYLTCIETFFKVSCLSALEVSSNPRTQKCFRVAIPSRGRQCSRYPSQDVVINWPSNQVLMAAVIGIC
jgi:hypothetical protein